MSDRAERRWTVWECDCGNLNQASFPGMQHPCWACNHPATIDCDEVCPVSELDALRGRGMHDALLDTRATRDRLLSIIEGQAARGQL